MIAALVEGLLYVEAYRVAEDARQPMHVRHAAFDVVAFSSTLRTNWTVEYLRRVGMRRRFG